MEELGALSILSQNSQESQSLLADLPSSQQFCSGSSGSSSSQFSQHTQSQPLDLVTSRLSSQESSSGSQPLYSQFSQFEPLAFVTTELSTSQRSSGSSGSSEGSSPSQSQHSQQSQPLALVTDPSSQTSQSNQPPPSSSSFSRQGRQIHSPRSLQNEIDAQQNNAKMKIQELVLQILESIRNNQFPELVRPRLIQNSQDVIKLTNNPTLNTKITFGGRSSKTFAMQVYLMSVVYKMIELKQTSTMRDLYYENLNFFGTQNRLSHALTELQLLLNVPREALCIEASAKGLVAGSISFRNANGDVTDASTSPHGVLIPNKLHELTIETNAKCILFVEKDATFQRLLDEKIFESLGPLILITGKGYPDIQTRRLMCILNSIHQLKVYAMVDCDPYGIEIAAIVKFGSYRNGNVGSDENCYISSDLSVPDLVWLGLLPSEVSKLSLAMNASKELTEKDVKKLYSLTERIKLQTDHSWLTEINYMKSQGKKTELEALFTSPMFTTKVYLPSKLDPIINPVSF